MDNAYALKKLEKMYSDIPPPDAYNAGAAEIIRSELLPLLEASPVLKYEFDLFLAPRIQEDPLGKHTASAFQAVADIMKESAASNNSGRLYSTSLNHDVRTVVSELLKKISAVERPKNGKKAVGRKKGARVLYRGKYLYEYKKKEYAQKNWNYARLCGFVYARCRQVGGKIRVAEVYAFMYPRSDYLVETGKNWKRIFDTVQAANRWAKANKLPKLMRCESQHIVRLGQE